MQRLSTHMRQVLALPVVIEDGSKVGFRVVVFVLLMQLQVLQQGTQLLSDMLDDSSLNVLIDQIESVSPSKTALAGFQLNLLYAQVFASLDVKSDSSARKLIQAGRTLAKEMTTKTGFCLFDIIRTKNFYFLLVKPFLFRRKGSN